MKKYDQLKPLLIYQESIAPLPLGHKIGFGNIVFLLGKSRQSGISKLQNESLGYRKAMYRNYMIDFVYKEKIGYRKIFENNTGVFQKEFRELQFPTTMHLVSNANRVNILKKNVNLICNLGEWMKFYFMYNLRGSMEIICTNFIRFLASKIGDSQFSEYNKVIHIELNDWISDKKKLALNRQGLNNPISILLVSMYKFQDLFKYLGKVEFLITDQVQHKVMRLQITDLNKKMYPKIKANILKMLPKECIDEENVNDTILDEKTNNESSDPVNTLLRSNDPNPEAIRERLISNLTKNLIGDTEDITISIDEDVEYENEVMYTSDDDEIDEMREYANAYIDEHPELLTDVDLTTAEKEIETAVKNHYSRSFRPEYSEEDLKLIQELSDTQKKVIGDVEQTFKDLESKKIDVTDVSDVVKTSNPNITVSKFVNFDRSYNEKKLQKDIDNCIGQLANANPKVFIVDKKEEDTSTALDLKKTLTYKMKDEKGRTWSMRFDVPIIFDDHFMYIKGNKKTIQHHFILKPIVKTGKNAVQIVSNYNKLFIERKGSVDLKSNALLKHLNAHSHEYHVINGNAIPINRDYKTTLEHNMISKKIIEFKVDDAIFILSMKRLFERMDKLKIKYKNINLNENLIVGIDLKQKKPIVMKLYESFVDKVFEYMPPENVNIVRGTASGSNRYAMYSIVKIQKKETPLVLLLMYYEGLSEVMKKAEIPYELIPKSDDALDDIDLYDWGITELADGYIKWKRYPFKNSLLMNGFNKLPMDLYTMEDMENKDTFAYLMTNIFEYANQSFNLDQYYDFMIDPITKEILIDHNLPTDLVSLCLLANSMLNTDEHTIESDLNHMRLVGNEVVAYHVYKAVTTAFNQYRKTASREQKWLPVTIPRDEVAKRLANATAGAMNEYSALNPVFESSKLHAVTFKGEIGTNEEHALSLDVRAFNESMLGVAAITTSPDAGVGINRQLTMEPNILSTRGYIGVTNKKNLDKLNSANMLSTSEMLTPLGVQHDDPTRTSMAYKQTIAMVGVDDSDPVLVGNGVEKAIAYHLSPEFTVVAEDDGIVVDKGKDFVVIKYNNGRYRTIETDVKIKKNASSGFFIENQLTCNKNIGDKVTKHEVVAWNDKFYKKEKGQLSASMRLGPLIKIAIIPEWDIYEDSAPISHNASERMTTTMVMPIKVSLTKDQNVIRMAKVGDHVDAGDTVILFSDKIADEEGLEWLRSMNNNSTEDIVEKYSNTKKSHYSGTISNIEIYSSVELDQLSDSLRKIVGDHWKSINRKNSILKKYSNPDDVNHFRSGNLISEVAEVVKPDSQGKIKGERIDEGVVIIFYVSFKDVMSRGDKLASEFALKSINSHVIDKGLEPYSESDPDEPIDLVVAPLSISARKTPSIFTAMFANKLMINAKRQLKDFWFNN